MLQEWPEPRSTNDLDLFLRPELLINSAKLKPLADAIDRLGYQVVQGAEKYQFVRTGPGGIDAGSVKVDILTGPQRSFNGTKVKADARRARPNPSVGIHAHPVNEAPSLASSILPETTDPADFKIFFALIFNNFIIYDLGLHLVRTVNRSGFLDIPVFFIDTPFNRGPRPTSCIRQRY